MWLYTGCMVQSAVKRLFGWDLFRTGLRGKDPELIGG